MSIKKRMLEVLDRQLAGEAPVGGAGFTLGPLTLPQVQLVRDFIASFRGKSENKPNKPAVAELAERLAKVEEAIAGVAAFNGRLSERLDALGKKLHGVDIGEIEHYAELGARITKVADIIGERVSGLVDEIAAVRDSVKRAHERIDDLRTAIGADALVEGNPSLVVWLRRHNDEFNQVAEALEEIRRLTLTPAVPFPTGGASTAEAANDWVMVPRKPTEEMLQAGAVGSGEDSEDTADGAWEAMIAAAPAFPTGGASTAEAAAEAVLPMPQRGDRVRLEGAKSTGKTHIKDGWYDVIGRYKARFPGDHNQFQVGSPASIGIYWVYDTDTGIKEVRHGDAR